MEGLKQKQANLTLQEMRLQASCGLYRKETEEDMWVLRIGLGHIVHELATHRETRTEEGHLQ